MSRANLKSPSLQTGPLGSSRSPLTEARLRRLDKPYRPGLGPWWIGAIVIAVGLGIGLWIGSQREPALDPSHPPPMPPLGADAERVYLIGGPPRTESELP